MSVSMALTLTPHRCHTPWNNRRISTIPTGHFGSDLANVSAVDTRPPVWSAPGGKDGEVRRPHPGTGSDFPCLNPSSSRTGPRRSCFDADAGPLPSPVDLLHEGWDLLAKGWGYCTRAPPTWSTPNLR